MDILEFTSIKPLGITKDACERYNVPQIKTKSGIKLGAIFSDTCCRAFNTDGSGFWLGDYDPNLGLFGQKAVVPGEPVIIVASELEALKVASLGFNAVSLAEPKQTDSLTFSILSDNLGTLTDTLWVWTESTFAERQQSLEKFLLHLASQKTSKGLSRFKLYTLGCTDTPIISTRTEDIKFILTDPTLTDWKPAGIAFIDELMDANAFWEPIVGVPTGYVCLDRSNEGIRRGEITLFTAGTGVGKSTIVREIVYHLGVNEKRKSGLVFLEEGPEKTAKSMAAIKYNIPYSDLRKDPERLSKKQWADFRDEMRGNFVFHRHFGSLDAEKLFTKIEYMIQFCGCEFIALDHISIAVSGMTSKEGERKDIDILMTRLATMAVTYNVGFLIISHLSQPEGAPHEEGGRVTLAQLRGSGSLKQLSWSIFALERNQQDPECTLALLRQLKGRENNGQTGPIGVLKYHRETGRLLETDIDPLEFEKELQPKRKKRGEYVPNNYRGPESNAPSKWVGGY